jgi:hypothetical protein
MLFETGKRYRGMEYILDKASKSLTFRFLLYEPGRKAGEVLPFFDMASNARGGQFDAALRAKVAKL